MYSITIPDVVPRINVIRDIGMRNRGSFQPIRIAVGSNTRNEKTIPLIPLMFDLE